MSNKNEVKKVVLSARAATIFLCQIARTGNLFVPNGRGKDVTKISLSK
jgi:hypothetical protein